MFKPRVEKTEMIKILKKHKDFCQDWIDEIEKEPIVALENSLSDTGKKMANRVREVQKEYHRQRSFLRLDCTQNGIVSAEVECHHNIEKMVLKHLHERFPGKIIIIHSKFKKLTFIFDGIDYTTTEESLNDVEKKFGGIIERSMQNSPNNEAEKENNVKSVFKTYYESQYIDSRYNPRYFHKFMTKKNLTSSNQDVEQSAFNRSLEEFLRNKEERNKK
jgi:probable DNA metabolism protein